jgi:hypothetical protein
MENDSAVYKINRNPASVAQSDIEQGTKSTSSFDAPSKPFNIFGMLRRNQSKDNKPELTQTASRDDMFLGELMENDATYKINRDTSLERGTDSMSGSDAPSQPFSEFSSHSPNSNISSSPGESSSSTSSSANEDFASMVKDSNTNPFCVSSCESTPNENLSPGKSPVGSEDSLDKYMKNRLSLDDYENWLNTVAESEDQFSKSDVSSFEQQTPKSEVSEGDDKEQPKLSSEGSVKCLDNLSLPLPPTPTMMYTDEESSFSESSVAKMSIEANHDGASAMQKTVIASDVSAQNGPRLEWAKIGAAFASMKSARGR